MNVLIVPEDFVKDQYILKPIFERLFGSLRVPNANITVCQDPRFRGVDQATDTQSISEVVDRYRGMIRVLILCVDRDCEEGRRESLDRLEEKFGDGLVFLAENAWQELETWVLAGLNLPSDWRWADVRAEREVKEVYFDVLARDRNVVDRLSGGRDLLAREAARRIGTIRQKCPEFDDLARRLESAVGIP